MSDIDISKINFREFKPHPLPDPIQGDIVQVEDDTTVTIRYFIVMFSVLIVLTLASVFAIVVFIAVLKWRWARRDMTAAAPAPPQDADQPAAQVQ